MRTTRSIALTLALAAAPLTAVAPAHAQNTPSNEAPASGTVTTQAEPSNGKSSSGTMTTQAEETTSASEEKDEDKGFPWGLLGLLGLAGLLGMGGRKREETEVRHTTTTRTDVTSRTDDLTQRADDRFGDGDGRLDRDDLPGTGRR